MVPIVNASSVLAEEPEVSSKTAAKIKALAGLFPTKIGHGFGCTGIIARNSADGTVSHARNLDLSPTATFSNMVFNGIFTRGSVEVYRAQGMAGYTMTVTGMKGGMNGVKDGFAIERNTRFIEHFGAAEETLAQLESGVDLNGWTIRKVFEEETTYDAAVARVASTPFASTEYSIISGPNAGTILSKSLQGTAHTITLGDGPDDYIIMTNFDFCTCAHVLRAVISSSENLGRGCLAKHARAPSSLLCAVDGRFLPRVKTGTTSASGSTPRAVAASVGPRAATPRPRSSTTPWRPSRPSRPSSSSRPSTRSMCLPTQSSRRS